MQHPGEIHLAVNLCGQAENLRILRKMLPAHQHSAEQDCGIDRGDFGMEGPRARRHIHEVIEKTIHSFRLQSVQHKMEHRLHASRDGGSRLITAVSADAECRQSESLYRDTRYPARVVSRAARAI